jgi:hypothetical protein
MGYDKQERELNRFSIANIVQDQLLLQARAATDVSASNSKPVNANSTPPGLKCSRSFKSLLIFAVGSEVKQDPCIKKACCWSAY